MLDGAEQSEEDWIVNDDQTSHRRHRVTDGSPNKRQGIYPRDARKTVDLDAEH